VAKSRGVLRPVRNSEGLSGEKRTRVRSSADGHISGDALSDEHISISVMTISVMTISVMSISVMLQGPAQILRTSEVVTNSEAVRLAVTTNIVTR
jgi:hypothetical protein